MRLCGGFMNKYSFFLVALLIAAGVHYSSHARRSRFEFLDEFDKTLDRITQDINKFSSAHLSSIAKHSPKIEHDDMSLVITLPLHEFDLKEVKVEVERDALMVRAHKEGHTLFFKVHEGVASLYVLLETVKKDNVEDDGNKKYSYMSSASTEQKSYELHTVVDAECLHRAHASFCNGSLILTIPKKAAKIIPITTIPFQGSADMVKSNK